MYLQNAKKFINYYGKDKKLKLFGFFILSLIAGLMELMGVALIYPFIIMITSPNIAHSSKIYTSIQNYIPNINSTSLALLLGLFILCLFIFKNLFMIFIMSLQTKFTTYWKRDIATKFMKYYTFASYKDIIKISPNDKMFCIGNVANNVIDGFVVRCITMLINIIIILMIVGLLFIKFPLAAIGTLIFISVSMIVQNKLFKKITKQIAVEISPVQSDYSQVLLDNVNNIKELKILSAEKIYYNQYFKTENKLRKLQIDQTFYNLIPPYIVEIFVVTAILVLGTLISIQNSNNNPALIASFAVIAAALFRIAPALNRIQSSIININTYREFVKRANDEYENLGLDKIDIPKQENKETLTFNEKIELSNVNFSYKNKKVLNNINLVINKGDFIGIVGLSGAGKSTLADVIMGLLPIDSGEITVDKIELTQSNFYKFRKSIGYVAQQVNVMDATFKENIVWGINPEEIDENKVIEVLKSAQLYDLVKSYEGGINAKPFVGANGLSQGQKQRLAIARALYRNPDILILDEATSSLDVVCENEITNVLNEVGKNKTIIAIAHRLSTLKSCNKLVYLKDGEIIDIGSFEGLSNKYTEFEEMVKLSALTQKK